MKVLLLAVLLFSPISYGQALFKDVGIIGLMSHDIFSWDHKTETNKENGRLDLSTIFDYDGGKRWQKGGDPKNSDNSPVYTTTMMLVDFYKKELKTKSPLEARKSTVVLFQSMVKDTYERLSGLEFPEYGLSEPVTNVEQAALRGLHDIMPGRVKLFDRLVLRELVMTNVLFLRFKLNEKELNQPIKNFDGDYDEEFKNIKLPFSDKIINLKEIDRAFIEKHSPYKQADMLGELAKVGRGEMDIQDVFFIHHITDLIQKGLCSNDNQWMPQDFKCY